MELLWSAEEPERDNRAPTELDEAGLRRLYDFPERADTHWVVANFVSSADGAVTEQGHSEGLSDPADKRIFLLGRELADVILVGANTVREENYRGARTSAGKRARRSAEGRSAVPPIAVVSTSAALDPAALLFTDTTVAPIVVTAAQAPEQRRRALAEAGADVIVAGERRVEPARMLGALAERGLYRVCCEGGPTLFGSLLADERVDELRLTLSPLLTAGTAGRIVFGPTFSPPRGLRLESVVRSEDSLMLRYRLAESRRDSA
jgi:5-amino-6-(5-phosphoribosylamino)uracil reductase